MYICGGQRTAFRMGSLPSAMWVLGIVPMSCGFGAKCLYQLSCLPDPFEAPVFASESNKATL